MKSNKYTFDKKYFLNLFSKAEIYLNSNNEVHNISNYSLKILKKLDIKFLEKNRKKNYNYLSNKLKLISKVKFFEINTLEEVPLFLVIHLESEKIRNALHEYLIKYKIYCPIHWNLINNLTGSFEVEDYIKKIISIPIDQRYSLKEMKYIYITIKKFFKEKNKKNGYLF